MSREYADTKIREALKLCNGNMSLARKQIVALAQEDQKLLRSLTRPHLDGIVAYQVERVASGRAEVDDKEPDISVIAPKISKDNNFGMDILRAVVADDVTIFGQDEVRFPKKRKAASRQHIDAIHKMASSSRQKNKD